MERMGESEIAELATRARAGDVEARNRLVEGHLKLLGSVARRRSGRDMDYWDAFQEGAIGLMGAASDCDPERSASFPTLARLRSDGAILNARARHAEMIRIPEGAILPDGSPPIRREPLPDSQDPAWSADSGGEDDSASLRTWRLDAALRSLSPLDAEVVARVYGLGGRPPETPAEVARLVGEPDSTLRSRCRRAMARLRRHIEESEASGRTWETEVDDVMTEDLTGRTFDRLYVEGLSGIRKRGQHLWRCRCRCGRVVDVEPSLIRLDRTRSCGCSRSDYHSGRSRRLTIDGRTMTVVRWAKESGTPACTIRSRLAQGMGDRDAVFSERGANLRAASNRRGAGSGNPNRFVEIDGQRRTVAEWARDRGVDRTVIASRLNRGWSDREAVFGKEAI